MQLIIRSGGDRKPYTAPVYNGYTQSIQNLYDQGFKAFFKGCLFRTIHQTLRISPLLYLSY